MKNEKKIKISIFNMIMIIKCKIKLKKIIKSKIKAIDFITNNKITNRITDKLQN